MTRITASFSVDAGTWAEGDLDVTGLTPNQIADLVFDRLYKGISLCHQCAGQLSDPEIEELAGFNVDGVEYEKVGEHWVAS